MSNEYDIQPFAQSLLSDVRRRKDAQTQSFRDDRDRLMRDERRRQRDLLKYTMGAKLVMGIGNSVVKSATDNFMARKDVLDGSIKFKTALNGAYNRQLDRKNSMAFEKGEDEWYTQKAMQELSPTFYQAIPETVSASERSQLIYNESFKAGQALKKLYGENKDNDLALIEGAGKAGPAAYTDALRASRPQNIGSSLWSGFKGLFVKDTNPLDNSIKATTLMESAENVAAYGELRKAGLAPWKAKEKVEEYIRLGMEMPKQVANVERFEIKNFDPYTETWVDMDYKQTTFADGTSILIKESTGDSLTMSDLSQDKAIARIVSKKPDQLAQFEVRTQSLITKTDNEILGGYVNFLTDGSKDQKRIDATADMVYARIMLTRNSLVKKGFKDTEAIQIATKMHTINIEGLTDKRWAGKTTAPERNLLVDADGYHPAIALMALDQIEANGEKTVSFRPAVKTALLTDLDANYSFYEDRLSPAAQLRFKDLLKTTQLFNTPLSVETGNNPLSSTVENESGLGGQDQSSIPKTAEYTDDEIDFFFNKVGNQRFKMFFPLLTKREVQGLNPQEKRKLFETNKAGATFIEKSKKGKDFLATVDQKIFGTELERKLKAASQKLNNFERTVFNSLTTDDEKIKFLKEQRITIDV
jgi:hypothetical protein